MQEGEKQRCLPEDIMLFVPNNITNSLLRSFSEAGSVLWVLHKSHFNTHT
jgi:hypothetical protein